jgi:hypothetical protein
LTKSEGLSSGLALTRFAVKNAWSRVTRHAELGGLGVIDLTTLGYALRLRWEWLAKTNPSRLWAALPCTTEPVVRAMFEASTLVVLGNGVRTLFWDDRWVEGKSIACLASLVYQ